MEDDHKMSEKMHYTTEEMAVIDGVIGTLYARMSGRALQQAYWSIHEHLQMGNVSAEDLPRIESALEFADPGCCTSCNKESYRELTSLLLKTRAMRRAS